MAPADVEMTGADFPLTGGCGDVLMYASTADGRLAVVVHYEGAATTTWEEDGLDANVSLPDASMTVTLESGQALTSFYCSDILMPGQGVEATTPAVSGSAQVVARPGPGLRPAATADLTLRNVEFEVTTIEAVEIWRLDSLELRNIFVGWFAG